MGIGKRIRQAMEDAERTPVEIARHLGISDSAVSQWFTKDTGPKGARLPELADFLKTTVDFLMSGETPPSPVRAAITKEPSPQGRPDIPVWASAAAGKDGAIILTPDPVDYIHRSERMRGVRGAYAFLVSGASMSPAIGHGDQVVVNPALLPRPGADCVFIQERPDGSFLALVKRLVRETATEWQVEQFNPKRKYGLPKAIWAKAQVIAEKRYGGL